jgi:O-acetyl-ADP-ribose deacetylase (regulator of RNase III)
LKEVADAQMLPRGAAILTDSGNLKNTGITSIIHAASGSSTKKGDAFKPTMEGVTTSVKNSLILAKRFNHKTVAVPFIGGSIFLSSIGVTPEELSMAIIRASLKNRGDLNIRFVTLGATDTKIFQDNLSSILTEAEFKNVGTAAQVTPGSITSFSVHGASAIVNAANMEVRFGGGISGAIASATGDSKSIDDAAKKLVSDFNSKVLEILNSK